jgi:hypothetical protein
MSSKQITNLLNVSKDKVLDFYKSCQNDDGFQKRFPVLVADDYYTTENENAAKDPILQVPLNPQKIIEVFTQTYPTTGSLHFAKGGYGRCLKADKRILEKWFEDNCPISDGDIACDIDKKKIKQYLDRFDILDPETLRKTSK